MIQLCEAPPRSGKTYYFVNYLAKFWEFDKLYQEFVLSPDVLVITNVEGLKCKHWKFPECMKQRTIEEFFTIENFERIQEKTGYRHIILAIDECHEVFPASMTIKTHPTIYEFFAYHGHIGLDVFLMTQGLEATSRIFLPLVEFIVKVKPRSQKLYKTFSYDFYTKTGTFLYSKKISTDQIVFQAYKSFRKDEHNKPRSAVLKYVVVGVSCMVLAVTLFGWTVQSIASKGSSEQEHRESVKAKRTPRSAGPEVSSAPADPVVDLASDEPKWTGYYVDGFLEVGMDIYYIIGERSMKHSDKFRNFDRDSLHVEYSGVALREAG